MGNGNFVWNSFLSNWAIVNVTGNIIGMPTIWIINV